MRINWGMFLFSLAIIMAATFWTLERNPSVWVTAMGVTHWMPLPEPPKEE